VLETLHASQKGGMGIGERECPSSAPRVKAQTMDPPDLSLRAKGLTSRITIADNCNKVGRGDVV
jgi:hypothetical protein